LKHLNGDVTDVFENRLGRLELVEYQVNRCYSLRI